jgi:hypothetical protein
MSAIGSAGLIGHENTILFKPLTWIDCDRLPGGGSAR